MQALELQWLTHFEAQLRAAPRGQKAAVADAAARQLGCSVGSYYRKRKEAGFTAERKCRSDAGASVLTKDELRLISGVLHVSSTQRGHRLPVRTALDMLLASGQLHTRVDESTVSRQLSAHLLHPDQLALPTASVQMAATHINHVWQVDSTTGIYYYMPNGRLRFMPEDQHYKNKLANVAKAASDLVTRYSCVDVASHMGKARHFLGGESTENLIEFLIWCIWKSGNNPMHGAPFLLVTDPGPANKSHLMTHFCKNVGIKLIHHAPGAARVTGSVEKFHDLIGMHFERRLRFQDPTEVSLDRLDQWLDAWVLHFCTTRVHRRTQRTRAEVYMGIQQQHLRVPVSLDVLREAAVGTAETRRVSNDRTISFRGRTYDLTQVPGVVAGLRVTLQLNVFRDPMIDVQFICPDTGAETWHVVEPAAFDEFGYRVGAPVWGQDMRTAANSVVDDNRNRLLKAAYKVGDGLPTLDEAKAARKAHAQAFAGVVDPMADVKATPVPAYLPRRATELPLPQRQVEARRLNHVEAAQALHHQLGDAYRAQVYAHLVNTYPDGVPEPELSAIADLFRVNSEPQANRGNLASGGGAL